RDLSSDVCSSDLLPAGHEVLPRVDHLFVAAVPGRGHRPLRRNADPRHLVTARGRKLPDGRCPVLIDRSMPIIESLPRPRVHALGWTRGRAFPMLKTIQAGTPPARA